MFFYFPALGGGEFFHLSVLKNLKEKGFFVYSACYCNPNDVFFKKDEYVEWDGIPVFRLKPEGDFIEKFIEKTKPDIVITQSFDSLRIIRAAKKNNAKTIIGVHFWRNICEVDSNFVNMLTREITSVKLLKEASKCYSEADQLYVNSKFMKIALKKYTGIECENIIHPIVDLGRIIAKEKKQEYITLINPDEGKGGDIFIKIAKKLPNLKFICVGKGNEQHHPNAIINRELSLLKNVTLVSSNDNVSEIYSKTKILLIPSRVDETFSMVALEAMFNGIPVLASNYGNLPYLIGGGGFNLPIDDIDGWESAINMLNQDSGFYKQISEQGLEVSKKYLPEIEMEKFNKLISNCLGDC